MSEKGQGRQVGFEVCWPASADAAWAARQQLDRVGELINQPHFHVMILTCGQCNQRFVSIFTEMIDSKGGGDLQEWTLLPITDAEVGDLLQQRDSLTETKLEALGGCKRCLRRDHPMGTGPRNLWIAGITLGWHD